MKKPQSLEPRDHAEAIAIFRAQLVGDLDARVLNRGELADELRRRSRQRVVPPGSQVSRCYGASTLERWLYQLRNGGLDALRPKLRSDRGSARVLSEEAKALLLKIREDHPSQSAALILKTLERKGLLEAGVVSVNTVRRLYREHELPRLSKRHSAPGRNRLRWEAPYAGALWHADVCHGASLQQGGRRRPLRIHGILDDHSRYLVALVACYTEQELDMLSVLTDTIRAQGAPTGLYLDNGATYRGEMLKVACSRLDIRLTHARPHDPQARGKMERLWRTLREGCLDHTPATATLHDVQVRLLAFVDQHYHHSPHSSLMGDTPARRWLDRKTREVSEERLREALVVRGSRRLAGDGTVQVGGALWEPAQGYLAGKKVVIARTLAEPSASPWVEYDEKRLPLRRVDAQANSRRARVQRPRRGLDVAPFDPVEPLVERLLGRNPGGKR